MFLCSDCTLQHFRNIHFNCYTTMLHTTVVLLPCSVVALQLYPSILLYIHFNCCTTMLLYMHFNLFTLQLLPYALLHYIAFVYALQLLHHNTNRYTTMLLYIHFNLLHRNCYPMHRYTMVLLHFNCYTTTLCIYTSTCYTIVLLHLNYFCIYTSTVALQPPLYSVVTL